MLRFVITVVASLLLFTVLNSSGFRDLFFRVPDASEVSGASASYNIVYCDGNNDYKTIYFEDEDSKKAVVDYNKFLVDNKYCFLAGESFKAERYENATVSTVKFSYRLKTVKKCTVPTGWHFRLKITMLTLKHFMNYALRSQKQTCIMIPSSKPVTKKA